VGIRTLHGRWSVATGDFDGDGKWDLAWRNFATGANVIWKSANAATRQALPTVPLAWSAGDVRHALPPHGRHPGI
jgi:hypothetical protein